MTEADVEEAASVGLGAGHIIFWVKAEDLPKNVTIGKEGYETVSLTIEMSN